MFMSIYMHGTVGNKEVILWLFYNYKLWSSYLKFHTVGFELIVGPWDLYTDQFCVCMG